MGSFEELGRTIEGSYKEVKTYVEKVIKNYKREINKKPKKRGK